MGLPQENEPKEILREAESRLERVLGGRLPVSPSMAKGPGRAPGTIAVVLGMAGGWADGGIQSRRGLPGGEAKPADPRASLAFIAGGLRLPGASPNG